MEIPTPINAEPVTMIAASPGLMIDGSPRTGSHVPMPRRDEGDRPGHDGAAEPVPDDSSGATSFTDRPLRRSGALTCAKCRITYLPSALASTPVVGAGWECARCAEIPPPM